MKHTCECKTSVKMCVAAIVGVTVQVHAVLHTSQQQGGLGNSWAWATISHAHNNHPFAR